MSAVASLLALYKDGSRNSAQVHELAENAIIRIDDNISELQSISKVLSTLVARSHGDNRPECQILDDLSGVE